MNRLTNQPLYPVPLDKTHPAFAGSGAQIICVGDQNGFLRNAGSLIAQPVPGGTLASGTTEAGSALLFNGSSTYLDFGTTAIPTDEFTVMWGGVFDALSGVTGIVDCSNGSSNGWSLYTSGTDMYLSGNHYSGDLLASGWATGTFYHGAARYKAGVGPSIFRNGAKIASSGITLSGISNPTNPFLVGQLRVSSPRFITARFSYFYLFDRYLSDDLIKSLQVNPWQIFEQEPEIIYYPASTGTSYTLSTSPGSFVITGTAAALKYNRVLPASSGSFVVSGTTATLKRGYSLQSASGSVSVSGTAASLKLGRVLQAGSGSVDVTGTAATLTLSSNKTLQADSGSFAVTGGAATLKISRVLPASAGSVQVNGAAASLKYSRLLSASPGSFAISGANATLTYQPVGNRTLVADSGSFAVSGAAASLKLNRKVSAASGAFAFTGTAATLRYARKVIAEAGAFAISGTDAILTYSGIPAEITSTVERTAIFRAIVARNATFRRSKSVSIKFN
jgi:hypothetical protein